MHNINAIGYLRHAIDYLISLSEIGMYLLVAFVCINWVCVLYLHMYLLRTCNQKYVTYIHKTSYIYPRVQMEICRYLCSVVNRELCWNSVTQEKNIISVPVYSKCKKVQGTLYL